MAWASKRGVLVGVVEVGDGGVDVAGSAGAEVGGYGGELLGIAGDEEEAAPLAAQMRQVASAMPEVAPRTRIFLACLLRSS